MTSISSAPPFSHTTERVSCKRPRSNHPKIKIKTTEASQKNSTLSNSELAIAEILCSLSGQTQPTELPPPRRLKGFMNQSPINYASSGGTVSDEEIPSQSKEIKPPSKPITLTPSSHAIPETSQNRENPPFILHDFELQENKVIPKNITNIAQWSKIASLSTNVTTPFLRKNKKTKIIIPLSVRSTIYLYIGYNLRQSHLNQYPEMNDDHPKVTEDILKNITYNDDFIKKLIKMKELIEIKPEPLNEGKILIKTNKKKKPEIHYKKLQKKDETHSMFPLDKEGFIFNKNYDKQIKMLECEKGQCLLNVLPKISS